MHEITTISQSKTLADKYYFAAYLNMARHNVFLIFNDIVNHLGLGNPLEDDERIRSSALLQKLGDAKTPPDLQSRIIRELHKHLPALKYLMFAYKKPKGRATDEEVQRLEYAPEDYSRLLDQLLKALSLLRNYYTHTVEQPHRVSGDLLHALRVTFDAGVRMAKMRFGFTDPETKHLVRQGKMGKERKDFKYPFEDRSADPSGATQDALLSLYGLSFFICLLLEKKYANQFTQQIEGLKGTQIRNFQATREVFAIHALRLPKARHNSETPENAFLLDMLNELYRCPHLLFPQLGVQHQDVFRISTPSEEDSHILLKRFDDRFVQFGLRFIDVNKWFEAFRFPVDLGNYHFRVYQKSIDGQQRDRSVWTKMIGYGRLQKYEHDFTTKTLPEAWQKLLLSPEKKTEQHRLPYISETYPHYHLPDDNIRLQLVSNDTDTDRWPDTTLSGEGDKAKLLERRLLRELMLSKYELFALLFYGLLTENNGQAKKLEDELTAYYSQRRRLYTEIGKGQFRPLVQPADEPRPGGKAGAASARYLERVEALNTKLREAGYDFKAQDLPDEIKNYLLGVQTAGYEQKATERLKRLIEETSTRSERIEAQLKKKRKPGSKKDVQIKAGHLGDFLAADILMFQPPDLSSSDKSFGKATSGLYQVLQAKLAMYGAYKDSLGATFAECGLIGGRYPHPFLGQVLKESHKGIVDFYRAYLKARLDFLDTCLQQGQLEHHWLKNGQAKAKKQEGFGKVLAAKMNGRHPIILPRGFFTDKIKRALLELNEAELSREIETAPVANVSFMLNAYFKHVLKDKSQDFYQWKRSYKIFDNYFDKRTKKQKSQPLVQELLTEDQRKELFEKVRSYAVEETAKSKQERDPKNYVKRFKDFESNEKQLRQIKAQDMICYLMIRQLPFFRQLSEGNTLFRLNDIRPGSNTGILEKTIPFKRSYHYEMTGRLADGKDYIIKGMADIRQEAIKIKNVGDFNRFIKDRRLNNLLAYLQQPEISREQLERELEHYDRVRPEIFRIIQEFEKSVLKTSPELNGSRFNAILDQYQQATSMAEDVKRNILNIRNSFSHNQYPEWYFVKEDPLLKQHESYAAYFRHYLSEKLNIAIVKPVKRE